MKRIVVEIDNETYARFAEKVGLDGTTPKTVIWQLVQDLMFTNESAGSDESMYANDWYRRIGWEYRHTYEEMKKRSK